MDGQTEITHDEKAVPKISTWPKLCNRPLRRQLMRCGESESMYCIM
jgi:hypothetical protein